MPELQSAPSAPSAPPPPSSEPPAADRDGDASLSAYLFGARARRQLTLVAAGATFCALSALVTRRALARRHPAFRGPPALFAPSNAPPRVPGPREALEALHLATLHVASWAVFATGGGLYAADIASLAELRRRVRGGMGVDGSGRSEREVEEEFEEWIVGVVERRRRKEARRRAEREGRPLPPQEEGADEEEVPDMALRHRNERGRPR